MVSVEVGDIDPAIPLQGREEVRGFQVDDEASAGGRRNLRERPDPIDIPSGKRHDDQFLPRLLNEVDCPRLDLGFREVPPWVFGRDTAALRDERDRLRLASRSDEIVSQTALRALATEAPRVRDGSAARVENMAIGGGSTVIHVDRVPLKAIPAQRRAPPG